MLIVVSVKNTNQVKKLIDRIKKIKNVYKAERKRS
jgi:(p)ppGpp synthase/HD superfamily hydrolase